MKKRVYLDHNASTPVSKSVQKAFQRALSCFSNPSALYSSARESKEKIESARDIISTQLDCEPHSIIFTSSGSESNNHVLQSMFFRTFPFTNKPPHFILSAIEHSSLKTTAERLAQLGAAISYLPCDSQGYVVPSQLHAMITDQTCLISVMLANNEIGTIQPIQDIVAIANDHGRICVHTDAAQAIGKIPVSITSLGVDFLSFSGHKFSAPKGIAGLYVKEDSQLTPLIYGGSQERKLRASTENVPGIIALAEAIKTIDPNTYIAQIQPLRAQLLSGLETLTHPSLIHNNFSDKVLSNTINVAFPGVSGHTLAMQLDLAGIEVSTGSACSVGAIEPSHVLEACGVPKDINLSSLRISLGLETSPQDIDYLLSTLSDLLSRTH